MPAGQMQAWLHDRQGVIVGPDLAKRMGWKVGETIPIQSDVPQKDGNTTWYFHLSGIYQIDLPSAYQHFFIGHYDYFNQGVADPGRQNIVFQFVERIGDARQGQTISDAVDKLFASATPQTLTQSEQIEALSQIRQFGNISTIVIYVGLAVFFTLLLIIGNTLAQSVHERTGEFAMFRALGFRRLWLVSLILQEALLLIVAGGITGLILGYLVTRELYFLVGSIFQTFGLTWTAVGVGVLLSIVCALIAVIVPVQRIARLQVVDALRRA